MEYDVIQISGYAGEHEFDPDKVLEVIKENCIDKGYNSMSLRPRGPAFNQEYFIEWARFMAENKIYFSFIYLSQYPPEGMECRVTPETVARMKEIAGPYFIGEGFGEMGSSYACKLPGYYMMADKDVRQIGGEGAKADPCQYRSIYLNYRLERYDDVAQAHNGYLKSVSKFTQLSNNYGMPGLSCTEATAFAKYNMEAGFTSVNLEMSPGNPEILIATVRGAQRTLNGKSWATFIAHEWYGGLRHADILKMKRLELDFKYAYLAGSYGITVESGENGVNSYGQKLDADSEVCRNYRKVIEERDELIRTDKRPAGGPKVKVAFVSGLHDGWAGKWGRSCLWNQFYREEWGYNAPEHSWGLLEELHAKRAWTDVDNYGEYDFSGAPAYGQYDIIPIEADVDKLEQYDYLIFLGWNTMTEENMDKLISYVKSGGRLVMSAAHLNTQTKRNGEYHMIDDCKVEELFGCRFMGEIRRTVNGVSFKYESQDPQIRYPVYHTGGCDPMYIAGYADYARFATTTGKAIAHSTDSFAERFSDLPVVIENKVGAGYATLVSHICYPGDQSVYRLYRMIVREMLNASARNCEIKVVASDRVRYSVYEGNKIYLLNTDYDLPACAKIIYDGKEQMISLDALELKAIQL